MILLGNFIFEIHEYNLAQNLSWRKNVSFRAGCGKEGADERFMTNVFALDIILAVIIHLFLFNSAYNFI